MKAFVRPIERTLSRRKYFLKSLFILDKERLSIQRSATYSIDEDDDYAVIAPREIVFVTS